MIIIMNKAKIVIIGGVAAGASAAARLRRLNEAAEILILERGKYVSYANCGLPYHIGGVIADRDDLIVTRPEKFASWFNIEVRVCSEVISIDRGNRRVLVKGGEGEYFEPYDKLIIATGASAFTPKTEGDDNPNVRHLWTMSDMDNIISALSGAGPNPKVTIVGGGFIGLETAENLRHKGVEVSLIQRSHHVLPVFDEEMARPLANELRAMGVNLIFGRTVEKYENAEGGVVAVLSGGERVFSNIVISSTGVKPNSELAVKSGIECSKGGFIKVDEHMRTSDENIYAAGDVVEIKEAKKSSPRYKEIVEVTGGRLVPEWLEADLENLKGTVKELPKREAIDVPVDEMLIVELYSK